MERKELLSRMEELAFEIEAKEYENEFEEGRLDGYNGKERAKNKISYNHGYVIGKEKREREQKIDEPEIKTVVNISKSKLVNQTNTNKDSEEALKKDIIIKRKELQEYMEKRYPELKKLCESDAVIAELTSEPHTVIDKITNEPDEFDKSHKIR